ncbi:1-acyl-sn-glycerol-3-phosphate acyltransferase [Pseudorhodobacter sp. MZDSW-24AT]|uniref:1-acyl-sn-glycerol-3-phosphate acyltransferase n=1 Tax=Pseudorhodobacter sp. MZDSW-24AT TaxID=2052957 RepID=UPI000C1F844A|nr:1-acyl-sn-glycerol-3-phosphate acyltransferase [Pseudorhodobacter sp. MZDSW-24AT]PJF07860.1 glycerol-3-phosphate acyltransferase [Pseudorhodobacter sp. MZDSW-24AT]
MFQTVEIPVWLVVVLFALPGVAALDRIIGPGVRWFFRRRMERLLARVNARLERKIEPFKLMRRQDMVVRLLYDPAVLEAVAERAAAKGVPGEVVLEEARTYAREIVPGFSALFYFGFATRAARALSAVFFRVRVGVVAEELRAIDPRATVIFVMNHRSNMDYVLVTWLVSGRAAISYAVGEWARVWPLSRLIRAMGAYFIRRGSHNALYRRVLSRYVQMTTAEGTTQAVFPEGGLSLTGRVGAARMGLLSYIWAEFDPASVARGGRDVVFVPVGLAYDRVLEDALLVKAAREGGRRFRAPLLRVLWEALRIAVKRAGGRRFLFGTAAAGFGRPISLRAHQMTGQDLEALGVRLMAEVERVVPVLAVPLVAASVAMGVPVAALAARLEAAGAVMRLAPGGQAQAEAEGRAALQLRGVLDAAGQVVPGMEDLLAFYAAPVRQRLGEAASA